MAATLNSTLTPTAMLGAWTQGKFAARDFNSARLSAERPVVPITIAFLCSAAFLAKSMVAW